MAQLRGQCPVYRFIDAGVYSQVQGQISIGKRPVHVLLWGHVKETVKWSVLTRTIINVAETRSSDRALSTRSSAGRIGMIDGDGVVINGREQTSIGQSMMINMGLNSPSCLGR